MQSGEETDNPGVRRGDLSVAETRGNGAEEGVVGGPQAEVPGAGGEPRGGRNSQRLGKASGQK